MDQGDYSSALHIMLASMYKRITNIDIDGICGVAWHAHVHFCISF